MPDRVEADLDVVEQNVAGAGDLAAVVDQLPPLQPYAALMPASSAQAEREHIRSCTTDVHSPKAMCLPSSNNAFQQRHSEGADRRQGISGPNKDSGSRVLGSGG